MRRTAAVAVISSALVLAGCSDNEEAPPESRESSSPSAEGPSPEGDPSSSPASSPDETEQEVLDAYQGYWEAYAAAVSEPAIDDYVRAIDEDTVGDTPLADVTTLQAQQRVLQAVSTLNANREVMTGGPERLAPEVTTLDMEADVPTADITDCLNVENWVQVDRETGEAVELPGVSPTQYVATAELRLWEGTWRVTAATPHYENAC
jgi:hypothetical protein